MTSSNTIETEYAKHMGYGEYKTFNLRSVQIGYRGDSNYDDYWWYTDKYKAIRFIASYSSENNEWDALTHILFNHGKNCQVIPSDHMIPWYNDSFLFSFEKKNNFDTYKTFYGYYENGDYKTPMYSPGRVNITSPNILKDENSGYSYVVPFAYDGFIEGSIADNTYSIGIFTLKRINAPDLYDFECYEWKLLHYWIDLGHQYKSKDKYSIKILEKNWKDIEKVWKIQLNVLRYDGEQINDEYVISLNEGKIIEHNGKVVQ